ncbi:1253_t:CDS:2 [Diversispora eburnea]|uniref:1253_t:CDS:1 n=1 Tax=Diversispora eburnea TaxID=1213867 RepID=A0A9N9A8Y8_9GLOM|nr:1253_t:CDS:2 [Diversispora eburnea]
MTFISQVNSCTTTNNSSSKSSLLSPANNASNASSTNAPQKIKPKTNCSKNNTLRILIHATMQLLTSPPISPSPSEEENWLTTS